jgi:hypothetical protein
MTTLRAWTDTLILDCDVHHSFNGLQDVAGYLPAVWREYVGFRADMSRNTNPLYRMPASGFINSGGDRLDSVPPGGGTPGSDPEFMISAGCAQTSATSPPSCIPSTRLPASWGCRSTSTSAAPTTGSTRATRLPGTRPPSTSSTSR